MFTMIPMCRKYKDRHMEKFKRFIGHIKLIITNRKFFWMHLEVHEVAQGPSHVHHDSHVPHVQGQAHGKVLEDHEAHEVDQHKQDLQEFLLNALRSA
jgi:hypothetical protein